MSNVALINARTAKRLSQDDLAAHLGTSKRQIQRWEAGLVTTPRPRLARALEAALGVPIEDLGFGAVPDGRGGFDVRASVTEPGRPSAPASAPLGNHSGVWLSRYEYPSSGRGAVLVGLHYVVVRQHGDVLDVRSIEGGSSNPDSPLTMKLEVRGSIVTGTWEERTAPDGLLPRCHLLRGDSNADRPDRSSDAGQVAGLRFRWRDQYGPLGFDVPGNVDVEGGNGEVLAATRPSISRGCRRRTLG